MAINSVENDQPTPIRFSSPIPGPFSLRKIKKKCAKVVDVASHVFSGIRNTRDIIDPKDIYLSKKISFFISYSSVADFFFTPAQVVLAVKKVVSFFSVNSLAEKVNTLLSLIVDVRDILQTSATLCSLLHDFSVASERVVLWVEKFNVATLFVDFICIGKCAVGCHHSYKVVHKLRKRCILLGEQKNWEAQKDLSLRLLAEVEKKKQDFSEDLFLSKRALEKKITLLRREILEKSVASYDNVESFFALLSRRAVLQSRLDRADLVSWVVSSGGAFLGFAPGFLLISGLLVAGSGLASFFLWGGKMLLVSKNPFGV